MEVVEETTETLDVIDLDRAPRPEKMAREARFHASGHEVAYAERAFLPRRRETIDEVRAAVDALRPRRVEFPEARPPPSLPPEPEPAPPAVPDRLRAAIEPVAGVPLVAAEIVHEEGSGEVVEATLEGGRKRLYVVADGVARPFEDLEARIDALPAPALSGPEAPPTEPAPALAEPEPAPAAPEPAQPVGAPPKKGLLGRFGRGKAAPAPDPEPPAEPSASEETPKRRFGLRRKSS